MITTYSVNNMYSKYISFYRATLRYSAEYAVVLCLPVRLFVSLSVTIVGVLTKQLNVAS